MKKGDGCVLMPTPEALFSPVAESIGEPLPTRRLSLDTFLCCEGADLGLNPSLVDGLVDAPLNPRGVAAVYVAHLNWVSGASERG